MNSTAKARMMDKIGGRHISRKSAQKAAKERLPTEMVAGVIAALPVEDVITKFAIVGTDFAQEALNSITVLGFNGKRESAPRIIFDEQNIKQYLSTFPERDLEAESFVLSGLAERLYSSDTDKFRLLARKFGVEVRDRKNVKLDGFLHVGGLTFEMLVAAEVSRVADAVESPIKEITEIVETINKPVKMSVPVDEDRITIRVTAKAVRVRERVFIVGVIEFNSLAELRAAEGGTEFRNRVEKRVEEHLLTIANEVEVKLSKQRLRKVD